MREDDYIKRGDVVRDIEELSFTMSMCLSVDECKGMKRAQKIIASIVAETTPAADVRPVVLCKDCGYCRKVDEYEYWCYGFCSPARLVRKDDFCSHGKAKV